MADENLIKFRTGATESTDVANNIARFNPSDQKIHYNGTEYGLSDEDKAKFALSADVPTTKQIQDLADGQISKANTSYTLTNYATTGALNAVSAVVSGKTTMAEVEAKGYATTAFTEKTYAKPSDIPTAVSQLSNDANYITSAETVLNSKSAESASNADMVDSYHASDISAMTNDTSKIGNGANFITTSATVANSQKLGGKTLAEVTAYTNDTSKIGNGANYITSSATVSNANTVGSMTVAQISALTNDTSKIGNSAKYITSGATVASAISATNAGNADTVDNLHASGISALTNDTSKIGNGAKYITSGATVANANTVGNMTVAQISALTNDTSKIGNSANYITSGATVANANTVGSMTVAQISALTNDTSKIGNSAKYITSGATVANANTVGNKTVAQISAMTNDTNLLTNGAGFITSSDTISNAKTADYATDADTVDGLHASGISALTNNTNKLTNGAGFIKSGDTVANAQKVDNMTVASISALTNNTNKLTNGAGFITSASIPTSNTAFTNDANYITSADTVLNSVSATNAVNADTLDSYHASDISAMTNATSKLSNDSGFITTGATVAKANATKGTLTIQRNGTTVKTFNGSASVTANITVPTSTTALTNDSGYITSAVTVLSNFYDKTAIDNMVKAGFSTVTASTLPSSGETNKIYFISASTTGASNIYDEYMYISSKWEHIGTTETDLSNYYTKTSTSSATQINNALTGKSDTSHNHDSRYYTESEINTLLAGYSVTSHTHDDRYYTESEINTSFSTASQVNTALAGKSNTGHTHTSGQVTGLGTMALQNTTSYSTATQVKNALTGKSDTNHTHSQYATTASLGTMAYQASGSYSTATEVKNALAGKSNTGHTHTSGEVTGLNTMALQPTTSYSTATQVSTALSGKANTNHTHSQYATTASLGTMAYQASGSYSTATQVNTALTGKSNTGHTHTSGQVTGLGTMALQNTSSYSTATEVKNALAGKSNTGHTHTTGDVTGLGTMATQATSSYSTATEVSTALAGKSDTGHTHAYLPLAGGTMKGKLTLLANQYDYDTSGNYALNANNSDIIGLNGLWFKDASESSAEGINFYRSASAWDAFWISGGVMYFTPNQTSARTATKNVVLHSGNSAHTHTTGQVTGLGTMATQATTSYSTATEVNTALGNKADSSSLSSYLPLAGGKLTGALTGTTISATTFATTSTALVTNLNADLLDGNHATAFATASHNHDSAYAPKSYTATVNTATGNIKTLSSNTGTLATNTGALATNISTLSANTATLDSNFSKYLPLAGGTVTGSTTFSGSGFGTELIVKRGDTSNGASVQFRGTGAVYGYLGANSSGVPMWWNSAKTGYQIMYESNSAHTHDYLPLSGGTMTGRIKGLSGASCDITNHADVTLVGFDQTGCSNCTAGTVVGAYTKQTYIRSSGDDLYHYNYAKTTAYKILDTNNSAHTHSYLPLGGGTLTGTLNGTTITGSTIKGTTISATTFKTSSSAVVSSLNADYLDGYHSSSFSLTSHTHSYLPLSGGTLTGGLNVTGGSSWGKWCVFSCTTQFNGTIYTLNQPSCSAYDYSKDTDITLSGTNAYDIKGRIYNISYESAFGTARVETLHARTGNISSVNARSVSCANATATTIQGTSCTYTNFYGNLQGTASNATYATYASNYVPLSGTTTGSPITGNLFVKSDAFYIQNASYNSYIRMDAGVTIGATSSDYVTVGSSHTASTITNASSATHALVDAYAIKTYISNILDTTITIKI